MAARLDYVGVGDGRGRRWAWELRGGATVMAVGPWRRPEGHEMASHGEGPAAMVAGVVCAWEGAEEAMAEAEG